MRPAGMPRPDPQASILKSPLCSEFCIVNLLGLRHFANFCQDAGAQYRSAIGIPGGIGGPLMPVVRDRNVHGMELKAGKGGDPDSLNTVWIYDNADFPFHRAEEYHQFYKGPPALKALQQKLGRIDPTGCPEKMWR